MPFITFVLALDLIALGIVGYISTGQQSATALIPSGIGVLFFLLALIAFKLHFRKHAMHGVAVFSLLGFGGTFTGLMELPKVLQGFEQVARPAAVISKAITSLICLHLFLFCLFSFVEARLARKPE